MDTVELCEAEKLVRSIRDDNNPCAAADALELRDKWLLESDLGLLHLSPDVRHVLETALEL